MRSGTLVGIVAAGVASTSAFGGTVRFVDASAAPRGDGRTWATAFDSLEVGIAALVAGEATELWVAQGTYVPTEPSEPGTPRSVQFVLPAGGTIYGGFAGDEQSLEERDWTSHPTILSGDL
ncbi:MAG: hypothetical protein KDA22_16260, partial [Phycisphaerales bacterium]|nr:hypothetical protein [Phycisphaerales bacterium]